MAARTAEAKFTVAKLNSACLHLWTFEVEMCFLREVLSDVLNRDRWADNLAERNRKNSQAKATMTLLLEDQRHVHLRKKETRMGGAMLSRKRLKSQALPSNCYHS